MVLEKDKALNGIAFNMLRVRKTPLPPPLTIASDNTPSKLNSGTHEDASHVVNQLLQSPLHVQDVSYDVLQSHASSRDLQNVVGAYSR